MKRQLAMMLVCTPLLAPVAFADDNNMRTDIRDAANKAVDQVLPMRASQFIGMNIYNMENASLGEVKDIVLDGGHTQISYVAVTYGGLLGIGDKLYAVPYQAFKYRPLDKGKLFLDISKDTVKNAQGFDQNSWPDLNDPKIRQNMMDMYHVSKVDPAANLDDRTREADARVRQAARDADRKMDNAGLASDATPKKDGLIWSRRYSQLKGADIVNTSNDKLGDVYDIVFDARNGHVNYVVLQRGGVLGIGDKLFAVPAQALLSKAGEEKLVLDVPVDRFKNAPGFDQSHWPDFADPSLRGTYDQFYTPSQTSTIEEKRP